MRKNKIAEPLEEDISDLDSAPEEIPILKDVKTEVIKTEPEKRKKKTKNPLNIFTISQSDSDSIKKANGDSNVKNLQIDSYYGAYRVSHGVKAVSLKSLDRSKRNPSNCAFVNELASKYEGVSNRNKQKFFSKLAMTGKVDSGSVLASDLKRRKEVESEDGLHKSVLRVPVSAKCPKFI